MKNYKNQLIIFSKNRACQLSLLLDSLKTNAPLLFDKISVLYKTDNEDYLLGYGKLKNDFTDINFHGENNFRHDLFKLIKDEIETTTFMVDDAVFYDKIMARKIDIIKPVVEDFVIFSLRLGKNCNYSHPANLHYELAEHEIDGEYMTFDYTKQQNGDFRYPLSTDGHIFNTNFIKDLLIQIDFKNPNTLEMFLQRFVVTDSIPTTVKSFTSSKVVSIPVNLVNDSIVNRHGLEFGISEKELNDKFIDGHEIDLNSMDFSDINGPHKEIKYVFK